MSPAAVGDADRESHMIVIFWRGLGLLVTLIVGACALAARVIVGSAAGEQYWDRHKWPLGVSLICAAGACWFLGNYLQKRPGRTAIDAQTGRQIVVQPEHDLFFIPVIGWAPILAVIALILFAVELAR